MAKKSKTDEIVKTEEVSTNPPTPAEEPVKEQGTVGIGEGVAWSLSIDRQSVQDAIELFAAEVGLAKDVVGPLLESHQELFDSIVNAIKFTGDPTTAVKQAERKVNEKATETTPKAGLLEVLGELAGSSSMCWDPRPTGVFDANRANEFAEDAARKIASAYSTTAEPSTSGTPTHVFYAVKYQRDWLLHATEKLAECVVLSRSNPGGVDSAAFDDAIDKVQVICTKIRDGVPILAGDAGLVVPSPAAIGSPEDRVEVASWRSGAPVPKPQFMTTKPAFGIDAAHPGEDRGFFPENATNPPPWHGPPTSAKPRTPATLIAIVPLNDWKNIRENSALAQKFGHLYRVHVCHDGESTDQAMQHERERGMDPHLWTSDIFE